MGKTVLGEGEGGAQRERGKRPLVTAWGLGKAHIHARLISPVQT